MPDKVRVVYDGHSAAVDIPVLNLVDIARGDVVELPADVAAELVERGDWKKADEKPAPKAAQEAGK